MQTQFSGGFSGTCRCELSFQILWKLRILILGTQLIVARASRAVENGSDYEDNDEDDDSASDSEDDDSPVLRPPPPPPASSPPTVTKVSKMRAALPVKDAHTCTPPAPASSPSTVSKDRKMRAAPPVEDAHTCTEAAETSALRHRRLYL